MVGSYGDRDSRAESLRQRQLQNQERTLDTLRFRTDYVAGPGVVGTRDQSIQRVPLGDVQRIPVGEQIVRDPALMRKVIMPTPMPAVQRPVPVNNQSYSPKVQKYPMVKKPSILYAEGIPTGIPVKKWPTSFKKAFHKPTQDETILRGLNNLDNMSASLLGRKGR